MAPFSRVDIAYFLEVVRHGHVGRAAAACGVTQPSVSKAIHRLEELAGVPLFERGAHGVRLTAQGEIFLASARKLDAQHEELVRTASELRAQHAGLLRIGLTNPAADTRVVPAMAELVRRRPGTRLALTIGKSDALDAAVERAELDSAVVPTYPGIAFACAQHPLGEDTAVVAARRGHPLTGRSSLTPAELADFCWVMPSRGSAARRLVLQSFAAAGAPEPRVVLQADYVSETVMGIVAATDLLVSAPSAVLRLWAGRVEPLPVPALAVRRPLVLLTRAGAEPAPLVCAFRDLLAAVRG